VLAHDETRLMGTVFPFLNQYASLPAGCYSFVTPQPVPRPQLIRANRILAGELGIDADAMTSDAGIAILAGNVTASGSRPLAMAYAGHQFGNWVPSLGDGRALLLGEVEGRDGQIHDIQLKGSGRTPYSRNGDGLAAIGPVLREYIVSEAMHALGVPTTRALAALTTGEPVYRERTLPGAILVRVARSHIRVGTFQYFLARTMTDEIKALADLLIARCHPHLQDAEERYRELLHAVVEGQANLVARWMALGFIHGVMNTDNMSASCETIDYGPCAFMDTYAANRVFSSIDHHGRYAYINQPAIALWNLGRLATCLLPLIDENTEKATGMAMESLDAYPDLFQEAWLQAFRAKTGLEAVDEGDRTLLSALLMTLEESQTDFTEFFRMLSSRDMADAKAPVDPDGHPPALHDWLCRWKERLGRETATAAERSRSMMLCNPKFIPRNHQIEMAIAHAEGGDFSTFERLADTLMSPYENQPDREDLARPPQPDEIVTRTFCGT